VQNRLKSRPAYRLLFAAPLALAVLVPASASGDSPVPQIFMPLARGAAFFQPGTSPQAASILWATDGTGAGTRSLGSFLTPSLVGTLPGLAFFLAGSPDEDNSVRLWRTDGRDDGTFPLSPVLEGFIPLESAVLGGRLLVNFCLSPTEVCSLYASDGSAEGTIPLAGVGAVDLTPAPGGVYFFGGDGSGLWRTDGTPQGTRAVRHLRPGWTRLLSVSGSRLFYMTGDESGELWTSDGTARGTTLVRTFSESGHDFIPRNTTFLQPAGDNRVIFVAVRGGSFLPDLWRSDGTPRGTVRLTGFQETSGVKNLRQDQIAVLGKRTLFVADNGVSGSRLWSTRGSLDTTAPLVGCPGDCPELLAGTPLVPVGQRVIFAARDVDHGAELWTSDGTAAGTHLLADLCPGTCDSSPADFTTAAGRIWFRVTLDGIDHLARTDGTPAGTVVLAPIPSADHLDLATDGRRVFFAGTDPLDGPQPWVSDGTPAGTHQVSVLPPPP
jgi:ELWxxDGT repeat protein